MLNDLDVILELTTEIVAAYVSNNHVPHTELASLIGTVGASLASIGGVPAAPALEPELVPAIPIRKSVTADRIICLEDGKAFKSLKRHLSSRYNMTPEAYRARWGLPSDYPMVAPNSTAKRSELARSRGFGRRKSPS